jgi:hypothetical protein
LTAAEDFDPAFFGGALCEAALPAAAGARERGAAFDAGFDVDLDADLVADLAIASVTVCSVKDQTPGYNTLFCRNARCATAYFTHGIDPLVGLITTILH